MIAKLLGLSAIYCGLTAYDMYKNRLRTKYNKELRTICERIGELHKNEGTGDKKITYTPLVTFAKETNYGIELIVKMVHGISYKKIENNLDAFETAFKCTIVGEYLKDRGLYKMQLIKAFKMRDYEVEKVKNHELFLGYLINEKPFKVNLFETPHPLYGGHTRSGKTHAVYMTLINSLYNCKPNELNLYLAQLKKADLATFGMDKLPHVKMLCETLESTALMLEKILSIINRRKEMCKEVQCLTIKKYNEKFPKKKQPIIFIVSEEFSFFEPTSSDKDEVKEMKNFIISSLLEIVKTAGAYGIFLFTILQRLSADNLNSSIKSQCLKITGWQNSEINSRIVLDNDMATKLDSNKHEFIAYHHEYTLFRVPNITEENIQFHVNELLKLYSNKESNETNKKQGKAKEPRSIKEIALDYRKKVTISNNEKLSKEFLNKYGVNLWTDFDNPPVQKQENKKEEFKEIEINKNLRKGDLYELLNK